MKHRITQTLLASWLYLFRAPEGCEDDARQAFMKTLNREPRETTQDMLDGIEFEAAAVEYAENATVIDDRRFGDTYQTVGNSIRGGQFQVAGSRDITVDGEVYQVYARADAIRAGTCYDVKYAHHYDVGKFLDSPQHPVYLYVFETVRDFCYVVSCRGLYVAYERYDRAPDSTGDAETVVHNLIAEFVAYLCRNGLYETYCAKWEAL